MMVPREGESVCVEIYEVDTETMAYLDALEGVPHHYRRETLPAVLENGNTMHCYTYLYNRDLRGKYHVGDRWDG